jgi:hypothetical protein
MEKPSEEDIRKRAHELWEQAGKPQNRDEEFWHLAEQSYATTINPRHCALPTTFSG